MNAALIREQLHEHIDDLPDDIVQQIADFTLFVIARRNMAPRNIATRYEEWEDRQWQDFSLAQFFREEDDVTYTLEDAREVYKP